MDKNGKPSVQPTITEVGFSGKQVVFSLSDSPSITMMIFSLFSKKLRKKHGTFSIQSFLFMTQNSRLLTNIVIF